MVEEQRQTRDDPLEKLLLQHVRLSGKLKSKLIAHDPLPGWAVPPLVEQLESSDPYERLSAVEQLGSIAYERLSAMTLRRSIETEVPATVQAILQALLVAAGDAIPLVRCLSLRRLLYFACMQCVRSLHPYALFTMALALLGDRDWRVRFTAALGLGVASATGTICLHALKKALQDEQESVRVAAALALTFLCPVSRHATGALLECATGNSEIAARASQVALYFVDRPPLNPEAVRSLLRDMELVLFHISLVISQAALSKKS